MILLLSERHADVRSAVAGEQPFDFVPVVKLDAVYALARKFAVDAEKPTACGSARAVFKALNACNKGSCRSAFRHDHDVVCAQQRESFGNGLAFGKGQHCVFNKHTLVLKAVFNILRQRRVVVCARCIDCKRNANQTGKVCGILPVDWGKLLLVSGLLTVLLFLLLFLGGCFL